jgi:hypothetical protein
MHSSKPGWIITGKTNVCDIVKDSDDINLLILHFGNTLDENSVSTDVDKFCLKHQISKTIGTVS